MEVEFSIIKSANVYIIKRVQNILQKADKKRPLEPISFEY